MRQCKDCGVLYRTTMKNCRYCDRCKALREEIRITKIRIEDYKHWIINFESKLIGYQAQHKRIKAQYEETKK